MLAAVDHGASAVGFVSHMPSGPGVIDEDLIRDIVSNVPGGVGTFLLTSRTAATSIIDQYRRTGVNTLQIVDSVTVETYRRLRSEIPEACLVQVVHVADEETVDEAVAVAPFVDALLLDSGRPSLAVKELGGTGRVHDWQVSRRIRESVDVPVYLAGGLNPENVRDAILQVGPYAVDVCSGVRTDGSLDPRKLAAFFSQVIG